MKLCQCGCGLAAPIAKVTDRSKGYVKGQPLRFIRGHATRGRALRTKNHGLTFDRQARRWRIRCRDGSHVYFYRAVLEAKLGRELRPDEEAHHRNEDSTDDRPENLEALTGAAHRHVHRSRRVDRCRRGHSLADAYEVPATGILQCKQCREIRRERERAKR